MTAVEIRSTKDRTGYGVGRIPGRKSVCLYRIDAFEAIWPVAYFKREGDAEAFKAWLESLIGKQIGAGAGCD